jgi:predicted hydrocarbon binding protein
MEHIHNWIRTLVDNLDQHAGQKEKISILENCGRNCIPKNLVLKVKQLRVESATEDEFLQKVCALLPHIQKRNGRIYVIYDQCYCPLMKDYKGSISPTYCHCSRGWVLELFEQALDRKIKVTLESSILQGDDRCVFAVDIS